MILDILAVIALLMGLFTVVWNLYLAFCGPIVHFDKVRGLGGYVASGPHFTVGFLLICGSCWWLFG